MRILVADDDEGTRILLRRFLERLGHEVIECTNGMEVLSTLFAGNFPQMVFLDWMMPQVEGIEVCRKIRAREDLPYTYIVMLTHRVEREDIIECFRSGANDYIAKPLRAEELDPRLRAGITMVDLNNLVVRQRLRLITSAKMGSLGEMASGIAHEVNNPLSVIMSHVWQVQESLDRGQLEPARLAETLSVIRDCSSRITKVVTGLRTFAGEGAAHPHEVVSVKRVLEDALRLCLEKIRDRGVTLTVKPVAPELEFEVNSVQVSHLLLNILENSVQAMTYQRSKWIEIEVTEDPRYILLAITDSGSGLPREIREKIFHPFFTTREVGDGMGLGLCIARGIAQAHHGDLFLDESNKHTRFVLRLPKRQPASTGSAPAAAG